MKYKITNIYKRTASLEVEAGSKKEALEIALERDDEPNNDDWLYDSEITEAPEND